MFNQHAFLCPIDRSHQIWQNVLVSNGLYESSSSSISNNVAANPAAFLNIGSLHLNDIVIGLHFFVLAFCILNTLLLVFDSYMRYFRMAAQGEFLKYTQDGIHSFHASWDSWITYLPLLAVFYFYAYNQDKSWIWMIGILFILMALVKIFREYMKIPVGKVLSGEDSSIIGRGVKQLRGLFGGGETKKATSKAASGKDGAPPPSEGGLLGEFVSQIGGLGSEALRQTTGLQPPTTPPKK